MVGYWGRPDETAEMIRDGWVYTGDLGYMDEDGYIFIVDRKKDLIKPGGFQVWPREVEEVIATHPAVAEVSVAGVPDEYQGEAVKAWVVLREGQQVTVDELRAYCRERLAGYKVPKQIEFRDFAAQDDGRQGVAPRAGQGRDGPKVSCAPEMPAF